MDEIVTRNDLAKYFAEQDFNVGAEIGVESGSFSAELCKQNPNLKLYCIDHWDLNPSRYKGFRERKYQQAIQTLTPYNCEIIKAFSMDAVKNFKPESLDFVYIDANHSFDNVMQDIIEWSKIVRKGGIVSGHDYQGAVAGAVDKYVEMHDLKYFYITGRPSKGGYSWWFTR